MRLTIGSSLGANNARISISNLPTHFLMRLYARGTRPVWRNGGRIETPLSKDQRLAVRNLLRLRNVKRGTLKG